MFQYKKELNLEGYEKNRLSLTILHFCTYMIEVHVIETPRKSPTQLCLASGCVENYIGLAL